MTDYTDMLEDTIWCNDRTIDGYGGWQKDSSGLNQYLDFSPYGRTWSTYKPTLGCSNKNDAFTVDDVINGNGKLTYPVGLLTIDEVMYAGGSSDYSIYYLYTGSSYWTLTPPYFYRSGAYNIFVYFMGYLGNTGVTEMYGVRPSISLKNNILYTTGDGTSTKPYVIEKQ